MDKPEILVLGIGNILLSDEGIGPRVIEELSKIELEENIELVDGGTAGADLIDVLSDRKKVVIIDAMDAKAPAGTVMRLKWDELAPDNAEISVHEIGLFETLEMTKRLKCEPRDVVIFGVQPESVRPGLELTDTLKKILPGLVNEVVKELHQGGK